MSLQEWLTDIYRDIPEHELIVSFPIMDSRILQYGALSNGKNDFRQTRS